MDSSYNIYSDLAVEANDLAVQRTGEEIEGVTVQEEQKDAMQVTRIEVLNESAARMIGKAPGLYVTIESEQLRETDRVVQENVSQVLAGELEQMIDFQSLAPPGGECSVFIVGLGNWNATPDALGPRVLHHVMVTRHLYQNSPSELRGQLRPASALAPGVLGLTGIETAEIIRGVIEQIRPNLILAIDALSARETSRLGTTIQICNTGIRPGSGVGQKRFAITREEMGVPVVALGVPTVINAVTIVQDAVRVLKENASNSIGPGPVSQSVQEMTVNEVLKPFMGNLIVSPKGIDELIQNVARVIGGGLNVALHPGMGMQDVSRYL